MTVIITIMLVGGLIFFAGGSICIIRFPDFYSRLHPRVDMFVDIALAYAMLNFIAVLVASRYFQKQKGLYDEGQT